MSGSPALASWLASRVKALASALTWSKFRVNEILERVGDVGAALAFEDVQLESHRGLVRDNEGSPFDGFRIDGELEDVTVEGAAGLLCPV